MANETGYGKLTAAGGTGAFAIIVFSVLDHFGYKPSAELAAAIQTAITAGAVWLTPHRLRKAKHPHPKHHTPAHAHRS